MAQQVDDEVEYTPPTAERVARRALVLAAVTCRGAIESDAGDSEAESFRENVLEWVCAVAGAEELAEAELSLLRAPLGSLDPQETVDASWRTEGLGMLAWALGKAEMLPYYRCFEGPPLAAQLGFMDDSATRLIETASLRPRAELERSKEMLFALHWRLRNYGLDHEPMDFVTFANECWFGPLEVRGLEFAEKDLALSGRPIGKIEEDEWRYCLSIARERQQAANWLAGHDEVYSEVSCDT